MNSVRGNAFAKLNLTLDVSPRNGAYHALDSLVVTVSLSDRIIVKKRRDSLISVTMHGMGSEEISPEHNNACKAGEAFVEAFQTKGADITVYKNIPIGAGLGGSSADAAGVLKLLAALYNIKDEEALGQIADAIGSDVKYLLTGGLCRMQGRGEMLQPLGACPNLNFLILCPKRGVSTAACYQKFDGLPFFETSYTGEALALLKNGLSAAGKAFQNGLFPAAEALHGGIAEELDTLRAFNPIAASMTGSGSAVFALFQTKELCEWAKSRYRGKSRAFCAHAVEGLQIKKSIRNPFVLSREEYGE